MSCYLSPLSELWGSPSALFLLLSAHSWVQFWCISLFLFGSIWKFYEAAVGQSAHTSQNRFYSFLLLPAECSIHWGGFLRLRFKLESKNRHLLPLDPSNRSAVPTIPAPAPLPRMQHNEARHRAPLQRPSLSYFPAVLCSCQSRGFCKAGSEGGSNWL